MQKLEELCVSLAAVAYVCAIQSSYLVYFNIQLEWWHAVLQFAGGFLLFAGSLLLMEINRVLDRRRWRKFWEREAKEQEARHG